MWSMVAGSFRLLRVCYDDLVTLFYVLDMCLDTCMENTTYRRNIHRTDHTGTVSYIEVTPNSLTQHMWAKEDGFSLHDYNCHACGESVSLGDDCTAEHFSEWLRGRVASTPTRWINAHQIMAGDVLHWEGHTWDVARVEHINKNRIDHKTAVTLMRTDSPADLLISKLKASLPVKVAAK